jgi:PAS domain S-box-containing protein
MNNQGNPKLLEADLVLQNVLNGASDPIYVKDQLGRYVFVNAACARLLATTAESIVGKQDRDLFRREEAQLMRDKDQAVLLTGQPQTFEEALVRPEGSYVYHTTKTTYYNPAGSVAGIIGVSRNITERKAQERIFERLADLVIFSAEAMMGLTPDGAITSWNAAAEQMFGYSCQEALGRSIRMLLSPGQHWQLALFRERVRRGEPIRNCEASARRKDGSSIPVALTLSPITDLVGIVVGASVIVQDITERRRAEKRLHDSEERQRLAVEAAHLGIWYWSSETNELVWTPQCRSMHGIGLEDEVSYERFLALVHTDDRARVEQTIQRALDRRSDYATELRVVWPDGSLHWLSATGRVVGGEGGSEAMMGVCIDITAQKQVEQERAELFHREQEARAEAQAATRAKDEFLAMLSHELRAPLQSMMGWTQILQAPGVDLPRMQKGLLAIDRNVKMQARLIEDLLDVSRIVAGKLRLANERVNLLAVVESALASAKIWAEAKSVQLEATLEPQTGEVLGDSARLEQVVSNLLSNAVKFTSKGGRVELRLAREETTARITVADTGAGISPEFLPYVFTRFSQEESTIKRSHGGLGLGLAIVRHLVDLHGGTVTAESAGKGQGATFRVSLPLAGRDHESEDVGTGRQQFRQNARRPPVTLEGVRVVVVDDDPDTRELLETVLRAAGAEVTVPLLYFVDRFIGEGQRRSNQPKSSCCPATTPLRSSGISPR